MQEPEIVSPGGRVQSRKSWPQAYMAFLESPHERRVLKMMPLVLMGVVPLSIADDFSFPFLGLLMTFLHQ